MPRQPRLHVPGALYHAVLRGNHRQAIFSDTGDYRRFEEITASAIDRYGASVLAYCWMTNHVHLAIRAGEAPLGPLMGIVASRYARAKQRTLATTGHLFERRYRARLVDADRYLLALVRYIHLNPVRAHLVADPRDYPWSSHRIYLGAACPRWLQIESVLGMLGTSRATALAAYEHLTYESLSAEEQAEVTFASYPRERSASTHAGCIDACAAPRQAKPPRSLDAIAAEVAGELAVTLADVLSARRAPVLIEARKEIARRAMLEGAANMSQVARRLNRAPSTLSDLLHGRR